MKGEGWKAGIGGTLVGLGALGAAGNMQSGKPIEGLLGGAILGGIGAALIAAEKKQKGKGACAKVAVPELGLKQCGTGFDKHFKEALKKVLKTGSGKSPVKLTPAKIKKLIKPHLEKPIHISDILGKDWKKKSRIIKKELQHHMSGSGKVGDFFKKASSASKKKFLQFIDGKTKFKPSTLLDVTAGVVGLTGAASAFIPGVDLISVPAAAAASLGLKSAAHIVRQTGRGKYKGKSMYYCDKIKNNKEKQDCRWESMNTTKRPLFYFGSGGCGDCNKQEGGMSPEMIEIAMKVGDATILAGLLGITVAAAAGMIKLAKKIKGSQKGKGVKLAGQGVKLAGAGTALAGAGLPKDIENLVSILISEKPALVRDVVKLHKQGQFGSGTASKLAKVLGVGITIAKPAYQLYKFLQEHPEIAEKLLSLVKMGATKMLGAGSGKIKARGSKNEVFYGQAKRTSGGLRKEDLMKNKRGKIVSKKKHELGKKLSHNLRKVCC